MQMIMKIFVGTAAMYKQSVLEGAHRGTFYEAEYSADTQEDSKSIRQLEEGPNLWELQQRNWPSGLVSVPPPSPWPSTGSVSMTFIIFPFNRHFIK